MPKMGFLQLNSCSGCMFAILGCALFPELLKSVDIQIFRLIFDIQDDKDLDVVFVEGGVTRNEDAELLRKLWSEGTKIIALGSCAVLGGIMSHSPNIQVEPVNKFVDPHSSLPGCPPPRRLIGNLLMSAIDGSEIEIPEKNVCGECPFAQDQTYDIEITSLHATHPPTSCFLREGVLCLGPVTRAGCEAHCINGGTPCDGCMGAIDRNLPSAIANLFSVLKVSDTIREYAALAFRYQKPELKVKH
ncbi:MAG: hypothetical protein ACFE89_12885 [Candidatus Hodarchaeota archaeon]